MWLPGDERQLLAGYYRVIGQVEDRRVYRVGALRPLLRRWSFRLNVPEYANAGGASNDDTGDPKQWVTRYFHETKRITKANKHLHERRLIVLEHHEHIPNVVLITLTLDGYELGRKYARWFTRSGLWFEEYRNHWFWLIIAFFGGAIGAKLIDFIAAEVTSGASP